jgi:predicted ATPase/serine phosphatase RsbU (regulator of sigma subunit)
MTENHPLLSAIREIKSSGVRYDMLVPAPMDENDIAAMIADAFSLRGDRANSLASLIKSKTGGNPFFVREFLKKLYTEDYIRFDDQWMWDTGVISQAEITDNISSILIESLSRLDPGLRELLQVGSCGGQRVDETVIAEASTTGRERSEELLSTAVAEGLIIKTGSGYKFAHDRIQETIYATIRDGEKSRIHLRIAEIMLRAPEPEITDKVFQIAGHLNAARSDVEGELRHRAAEINARAGARARQAAAFDSVIPFYASALDFLSPDPWTGDYRLSLDLHTGLAESNYLTGRHGEGERFFASVLAHARNVLDTVEVYDLRISYLSSRRLFADALDTGRQALRRFGIRIPRTLNITPLLFELTRALMHTWKLGAEGISALPGLTDVKKLAISRLLVACIEPSYLGAPDSLPHIVLKLFNLAIRNGNSPYGAYSYVLYSGILMEIFGRIESVFRFGNLALEVIEKGDQRFLGSKINFIYGVGVRHWKWHVSEDIPYLQKSFNLASETGDLSYASYALHHLLINSFFSGEPLPDLIEKYANNYALMKKFNLLNTLQSFEQFYQFIVNLHSESEEEPSLSGKIFSEREVVPEWHETESLTVLGHYHVCRLMTLYLSGRFDEAVSAAGEGMRYLKAMMGLYFLPEFNFFHSLALIARCRSGKSRRRDIRAVKRNQRQMRKWAAQAPDNFRAKYELVESELNSLKQGMSAQLAGYDAAIGLFEKHGFLRDEALACELTFRFLLERGFPAIAETYLVRSLIAYKKWGCRFKSRILEKEYRAVYNRPFTGLFENIPGRHNPGLLIDSSTHFSVLFDINAIIKSSQALSREIHLHSLIESLMKIAIENAGAQKGVLIMQRGQNLFVEAEIHSSVRETSILGSKPLSQYVDRRGGGPGLPMSILNYVSRTMEDIVLDNAQAEYKFNSDPYISANGVKSVLCAPIAYQGELTGILYLENNVITGAFTPERIRVLKILSSQAAISLEIASLYEGLERLVDERTETIDQQKRELEHQIELAAQIQNALLPREIPSVSDISIAFRYLPMMNIGGDFLDIKTSDDDLGIGFFICDVSGHGVAAALIASMVKMSLSNWEETLSAPAETLKSLHNLLSAKIGRNFITAAICYIDLKSSRCTFASAGHTPFIIARRSGETEILHVRGRVINSLMTPEYREHVTDFNTGDTIILYTDGVVEAFNADRNLFGWDALLSLVKNNPGKSPDELCDSIIKAVSTFTGQTKSFDDDITILAIRHEDRGK